MTNDNRKQILAHQAIEDANDSSYHQQQMEQHREMILAQDQNIRRLKAELADMTAQRDTWQTMAIELEQQPERLKTVELTSEQERIVILDVLPIWHITTAGRAALAAYKARNGSEGE